MLQIAPIVQWIEIEVAGALDGDSISAGGTKKSPLI